MKEIMVVEPLFFSEFQCVGSECREHCCKGWNISLDKPSVKRYLKSKDIEIRNIALENIITTKSDYSNWGRMKLSESGSCAFMDEQRLCKVHKSLGPNALSPICASYPRMQTHFKNEIHNNLTLSCPESTRLLLSGSDTMLFSTKTVLRAGSASENHIEQESQLINIMCTNMIISSAENIEQGLYAIALLFMFLEKVSDSSSKYDEIENYYFNVIDLIKTGKIENTINELNSDYELQWALLLRLQVYLSGRRGMRGWATMQHYVDKLVYIQSSEAESDNNVRLSMARLASAWQYKVLPWLNGRSYILNNYMQYRMFSDVFPGNKEISHLSNLYLLTSEWFLIKSLISACVEMTGKVEEDDIINVIYSFHAVTKHDKISANAFLSEIEKSKVNDDLSLIYLLK